MLLLMFAHMSSVLPLHITFKICMVILVAYWQVVDETTMQERFGVEEGTYPVGQGTGQGVFP